MLQDFFVPFVTIALAELGDKTQLAMMSLATRNRHLLSLFLGATTAAVIVDGSAVFLGRYLANHIPKTAVSVTAAIIFIAFGIFSLISKEGTQKKEITKKSAFATAFLLFFISELGDKTQLAALLFGTQYNLILTTLGVILAMSLLIFMALAAGRFIKEHLNETAVKITSASLFIGIGLFMLAKNLFF
jgi:Ca2+/H+ antiporter, TMEM165/GDT1 family